MKGPRFCPVGQHFLPLERFATDREGRPSRDCVNCMRVKKAAWSSAATEAPTVVNLGPGIDIDRIHYKRGAVAEHLRTRRYPPVPK